MPKWSIYREVRGSIYLIDSAKSYKFLKTRFESNTMALKNLATSGVAVRETVMAVEVEVKK